MTSTADQFPEMFKIEIDGWCCGIERYPGEIYPGLVLVVIKEMKDILLQAVEKKHVFSVLELAEKFGKAAKYVLEEKDLAFAIIAQLPNPMELTPEKQQVLVAIVNPVEAKYGGAIKRLKHKWALENQRKKQSLKAA